MLNDPPKMVHRSTDTAENDMTAIDNSLKSRLYYFRVLGCDDEDVEE